MDLSRKEAKLTEIFEIMRLEIWTVDGGLEGSVR